MPPTEAAGAGDLVVRGGSVLRDGTLRPGDVVIRDGRIVDAPAPPGAAAIDAGGCVVVPGFVQLQMNGAVGIDLTAQPERLWELAALLPRWGVTSWLPTIVTSPEPVRERALAALRAGPPDATPVATPLGLHLEGPFLNPARKGAHAERHIVRPDTGADLTAGWSRDAGVALVTLAPELPGALDLVRSLVDRGVVVSLGHSAATADQATAGVDAGARWATHLFNTMPPLHHRDPGLAAVALTDERLHVGLIADGLHVHPLMVRLAAGALGERLTLVTDAVAALGLPPGPIRLGDLEALADEDGVRLPDGTLAGSNLSMPEAVANLRDFADLDLPTAVHAATAAPARLLGDEGARGTLAPGAVGDLVVLDDFGRVAATVIAGRVAHRADDRGSAAWRS